MKQLAVACEQLLQDERFMQSEIPVPTAHFSYETERETPTTNKICSTSTPCYTSSTSEMADVLPSSGQVSLTSWFSK